MQAYHNSAVLQFDDQTTGNAGAGVPVTVRINSTQAIAPIFDLDEVGIANPTTTDSKGNYAFKVDDGVYDIIISEGTSDEVVLEKVQISEFVGLINDLSQEYIFDSISDFENSSELFPDGKIIRINDITDGDLVPVYGEIVATSTVTINNRNTFESSVLAGQSLAIEVTESTYNSFTWYVDSLLGSDKFSNGATAGSGAFKTTQYAIDQLPNVIKHQQSIQLSDGVYNTSSRPSGADPRPATIQMSGKVTTFRSALSGVNVSGPIVIKGNPTDNTLVKVQNSAGYPYGLYNNGGQIALQDLTINTTGSNGGILLVSHRNTAHTYCKNVIIDSIFPSRTTAGASTESGGQLEFVDGKIKNCSIGAFEQGAGENMTFATRDEAIFENNDVACITKNGGYLSLNAVQPGNGNIEIVDSSNTQGIQGFNGSHISMRGANATEHCQTAASIDLDNATMDLVFSDTKGDVILENGAGIKYNASNYQKGINANASDIWLATSNSYISPALENDDARAVTLISGSRINKTGTNNIVGSGGLVGESYNPGALAYTAAAQTKSIVFGRDAYEITSSSGTQLDSQIDSTDVAEGRQINCYGSVNSVTFIDGAHMDIGGSVTIGQSPGQYTGFTLIMINQKWRLSGLGALRV